MKLMEKLAALVPAPRVNLVRYHGVLAPRSAWRDAVVPAVREPVAVSCVTVQAQSVPLLQLAGTDAPGVCRRRVAVSRLPWAEEVSAAIHPPEATRAPSSPDVKHRAQ